MTSSHILTKFHIHITLIDLYAVKVKINTPLLKVKHILCLIPLGELWLPSAELAS